MARYNLLISLAAASLTFSIAGARAGDSSPLPPPGATPTAAQTMLEQCRQRYDALKQDAEAKAQAIKDAGQARVPASTACKLIIAYEEAELRMIGFVDANLDKCSIPNEILEKIKGTHVTTAKLKGSVCVRSESRWRE